MAEIISQTQRLRMRTWLSSDVDVFYRHLNTEAVRRYLGGVKDYAAYTARFERMTAHQSDYGHCLWIIERLSDGMVLGNCGLLRCSAPSAPMQGDFEIAWGLREDAWGAGYAREAAESVLTLAFAQFKAPHVSAITCKQNAASWGLMQRLGMHRVPELDFIDPEMPEEVANNTIVYRLYAEDWTQ